MIHQTSTKQILLKRSLRFASLILALLLSGVPALSSAAEAPAEADRLSIAVEALNRLKGMDLEANAAVKTAVYKVLGQIRGKPQFVEIVRDFKIKDQDSELLKVALKNPDNATGVDSLLLMLENGSVDLLRGVLEGGDKDQAILLAVLAGNSGANQIAALLKPLLTNSKRRNPPNTHSTAPSLSCVAGCTHAPHRPPRRPQRVGH